MRIVDTAPREVVSVHQYDADLEEEKFRSTAFLQKKVGETLCARLIVNCYGDHDDDFAGDFPVRITTMEEMKPSSSVPVGTMKVELEHADDESVRPSKLCLTPNGILVSRSRILKFTSEEGYFPFSKNATDEISV